MGTIIAFILLAVVLIILGIALSKVSAEKEIYMSKYKDLDKSYRSVLNAETEKLNNTIKNLKEELDRKTKKLDEYMKKEIDLKEEIKNYKQNHTNFIKEVPMRSLAFATEVVVPREFRNDKDYMDTINNAACNKLAEAICENEAYEVTENFDPVYNQYHLRYMFRFFK